MKKLAILFALVLSVSLLGCAQKTAENKSEETAAQETAQEQIQEEQVQQEETDPLRAYLENSTVKSFLSSSGKMQDVYNALVECDTETVEWLAPLIYDYSASLIELEDVPEEAQAIHAEFSAAAEDLCFLMDSYYSAAQGGIRSLNNIQECSEAINRIGEHFDNANKLIQQFI